MVRRKTWLLVAALAVLVFASGLEALAFTAVPTDTKLRGRLEITHNPLAGGPQTDHSNEMGGFLDDGYYICDRSGGVGTYGIQNTAWPDYWLYGLNLSVGYRTIGEAIAGTPNMRDILNRDADVGDAEWTISYYSSAGGPHPDLAGGTSDGGPWWLMRPTQEDRQAAGNPFNPATDDPYMSVAWGSVADTPTAFVEYDAAGRAPGDPGYDPTSAGFTKGGYTKRIQQLILNVDSGGVWDFGPTGTLLSLDPT